MMANKDSDTSICAAGGYTGAAIVPRMVEVERGIERAVILTVQGKPMQYNGARKCIKGGWFPPWLYCNHPFLLKTPLSQYILNILFLYPLYLSLTWLLDYL
jgi:hypothetical protein